MKKQNQIQVKSNRSCQFPIEGKPIRTWVISTHQGRSSGAVSGIAKTEDGEKDEGQKNQAKRKGDALAEILRDAYHDQYGDDDVHERDKIEQ